MEHASLSRARGSSAEREQRCCEVEAALEGGPTDDRPDGARSSHRAQVVDARDATGGEHRPSRAHDPAARSRRRGPRSVPTRATAVTRNEGAPAATSQPERLGEGQVDRKRSPGTDAPIVDLDADHDPIAEPAERVDRRRLVDERPRPEHDAARAGVEHRLARRRGVARPPLACTRTPERRHRPHDVEVADLAVEGEIHVDHVHPARARLRRPSAPRRPGRRRTPRPAPARPACSAASRPPATSIAGITSKLIARTLSAGGCDDVSAVELPVVRAAHRAVPRAGRSACRCSSLATSRSSPTCCTPPRFVVVAIEQGQEVGGAYEAEPRRGHGRRSTLHDARRSRRHPPSCRSRAATGLRLIEPVRTDPYPVWRIEPYPDEGGAGTDDVEAATEAPLRRTSRPRARPPATTCPSVPHDPVAASYVLAAATPGPRATASGDCSRWPAPGSGWRAVRAIFRRETATGAGARRRGRRGGPRREPELSGQRWRAGEAPALDRRRPDRARGAPRRRRATTGALRAAAQPDAPGRCRPRAA